MAGRAVQRAAAAAQQHVSRFARVGGTAARRAAMAKAALPGEGIAREQNLVAARAGPVDRLSTGDRAAVRRRLHAQKRAAQLIGCRNPRLLDVFKTPAVAGLATDADLQQMIGSEAPAHLHDPLAQRRGDVGHCIGCPAQVTDLIRYGCAHGIRVGHLQSPTPAFGYKRIHQLALVGGRALAQQRAPQREECRRGVVAQDAGLVPHGAGFQPRTLAHHHRIALQPERGCLEEVAGRQDDLVVRVADDGGAGLRACDLDARKVLAGAPTDHAGNPIQVIAEAPRVNPHESCSGLQLETRLIVLELPGPPVEGRPNPCGRGHAGHLPHG